MSTTIPPTYSNADYEAAQQATYERAPRHPIRPVHLPGVREADFARAVQESIDVVGKHAVFIGDDLSDCIDP
jgi:hypothetical protein